MTFQLEPFQISPLIFLVYDVISAEVYCEDINTKKPLVSRGGGD
jgi:hypothetical protein